MIFAKSSNMMIAQSLNRSPANVIPMPKNGKYRDMVNMNRTNVHFRFHTQRDFKTIIDGFWDKHSAHTSASRVIQ
jgi:hypothetical protein